MNNNLNYKRSYSDPYEKYQSNLINSHNLYLPNPNNNNNPHYQYHHKDALYNESIINNNNNKQNIQGLYNVLEYNEYNQYIPPYQPSYNYYNQPINSLGYNQTTNYKTNNMLYHKDQSLYTSLSTPTMPHTPSLLSLNDKIYSQSMAQINYKGYNQHQPTFFAKSNTFQEKIISNTLPRSGSGSGGGGGNIGNNNINISNDTNNIYKSFFDAQQNSKRNLDSSSSVKTDKILISPMKAKDKDKRVLKLMPYLDTYIDSLFNKY